MHLPRQIPPCASQPPACQADHASVGRTGCRLPRRLRLKPPALDHSCERRSPQASIDSVFVEKRGENVIFLGAPASMLDATGDASAIAAGAKRARLLPGIWKTLTTSLQKPIHLALGRSPQHPDIPTSPGHRRDRLLAGQRKENVDRFSSSAHQPALCSKTHLAHPTIASRSMGPAGARRLLAAALIGPTPHHVSHRRIRGSYRMPSTPPLQDAPLASCGAERLTPPQKETKGENDDLEASPSPVLTRHECATIDRR